MCIKIVRTKEEIPYSVEIPLEQQVRGSKHILIDYDPSDSTIEKFINELERVCKTGVNCSVNIKVVHNNHIGGARIANKTRQLESNLALNDIVKKMVEVQKETDKKLEELASICLGKENV